MSHTPPAPDRPLSAFARLLPRSGIRAVMEAAAHYDDVLSLAAGEPSFRTPPHIVDAALDAARAGHTRYTPSAGIAPLRAAIASRYTAKWHDAVDASQVLVAAGAVNAILASLRVVLDHGDHVLIPDPGWPNYVPQVQVAGGIPVSYPLRREDGYQPDPALLDRAITDRTRVIITNNPSNPCGAVWTRQATERLMAWAAARDIWVLADEIYEDLIFDGEMVVAAPLDRPRTIAIGGCSKSYAMTGWRIGWAIAPAHVITHAGKVIEPLISCASDVSQQAALAALQGPQGVVVQMRDAYRRRRDLVAGILGPAGLLPLVPGGAFYALVDLRVTGLSSQDAALRLIDEERLATVPGSAFGAVAEGFVRISLASDDADLIDGCTRLVRFARRHG